MSLSKAWVMVIFAHPLSLFEKRRENRNIFTAFMFLIKYLYAVMAGSVK